MADSSEILHVVQKLFQLQEERVHTIKLFEEGYKIYMSSVNSSNLGKFRRLVVDVTKDFKRITTGVLDVAKSFRSCGYSSIADLISSLQQEEEDRLQLCAKMHLAKQDAMENPEKPELWTQVAALKEHYNKSVKSIDKKMEQLREKTEQIS